MRSFVSADLHTPALHFQYILFILFIVHASLEGARGIGLLLEICTHPVQCLSSRLVQLSP
jgi:hypothetical protein